MVTTPLFPPPRERRARQSPCPRGAHRKARFSVAEYYTYQGAASRCFEGTFHIFANVLAKTFHFCAVGIFHVFVYDDNYAGQTSIRVHRRAMDLRADLDKGAAGCPIAVLSRRICAKACVKTRPTACPHSVCPAEKIHVRSRRTHLRRFALLRRCLPRQDFPLLRSI